MAGHGEARDRARGCLLGLACGDALGRPIEFATPERLAERDGEIREMQGYGAHGQPAGTVTDATDLALCIARSLVANGGFDGADVARRFVEWYDGDPVDYGLMTADAVRKLDRGTPWTESGRAVWESRPEGENAGNGSVMRCPPYALAYRDDPERLVAVTKASSAITHADERCTVGCALLALTLAALVDGDGTDALDAALDRVGPSVPADLREAVDRVPDGVGPDDLTNAGGAVGTVQAGLYHGLAADAAEDAVVAAVNMGGDADTLGAVTGAVAGARFGAGALPDRWVDELAVADELRELADDLLSDDYA